MIRYDVQFYCPAPGCSRSFAELWRLKVHFRAPPDVRGSGKERGHGTELKFCPKCGKELKPGKHHVGCAAGKSAPRQAAKRRRHVSSSEEDPESGNQSSHSSSWQRLVESAVQRRRTRTRRPRGAEDGKAESEEMLVVANPGADIGAGKGIVVVGDGVNEAKRGGSKTKSKSRECKVEAMEEIRMSSELLGHGPLDSDLLPNLMDTAAGVGGDVDGVDGGRPLAWHLEGGDGHGIDKLPSPPPLPLEWELGGDGMASSHGFLFDFGQFDTNRVAARRQSSVPEGIPGLELLDVGGDGGPGVGVGGHGGNGGTVGPQAGEIGPHTTAVSSMTPQNMSNPSDDYIWQILFANPTDDVPKRVTAHMHHPSLRNEELATLEDVAGVGGGHGAEEIAGLKDDYTRNHQDNEKKGNDDDR